jgi:hypothetical protein
MPKAVKKPAVKKAVVKKVSDDSDDSLDSVYQAVEKVVRSYSPPLSTSPAWAKAGKKSLQLTTAEPVAIPKIYGGKPTKLMVAAVMEQKNFVGFYLMSIYMNPALKKKIPAPLLKFLKGKSCFNLKRADDALLGDIKQAIDATIADYRTHGWM